MGRATGIPLDGGVEQTRKPTDDFYYMKTDTSVTDKGLRAGERRTIPIDTIIAATRQGGAISSLKSCRINGAKNGPNSASSAESDERSASELLTR